MNFRVHVPKKSSLTSQLLVSLILTIETTTLETVHLENFEKITDMFLDCDLYILSPEVQVENVASISQPKMLYNNYETYIHHYFHHPNSGRPIGPPAPPGGTELIAQLSKSWHFATRRPCKAELVVYWSREDLEKPSSRIRDLFALEQDLDSAFVYHVLIHRGSPTLTKTLFLWNVPQQGSSGLRRTLAGKVRGPYRTEYMATMYQVTYAMDFNENRTALQHQSAGKYAMTEFLAVCLRCLMDDIVKDSSGLPSASLHLVASDAIFHGSIAALKLQFSNVIASAYVVIDSIAVENYLTTAVPVGSLSRNQDSSRRQQFERDVFTKTDTVVYPEEIMVYFIQQKHANTTIVDALERGSIEFPQYVFETIAAIGQPVVQQGGPFFITDETSLVFVTCSNVTQTTRALVFTQPYDTASWVTWLLTSTVVCFILYITIDSNRSMLNAISSLVLMIFRILIENFHDLSRLIKKKPTVFAMLTAFIALCAITLTNGYRGVLTSDLVMAPIVGGPVSFEELIRQKWRTFPSYNSRLLQKQETNASKDLETRSNILYGRMMPIVMQLFTNDLTTEYYYQSRENRTVSAQDNKLKQIYKSVQEGYISSMVFNASDIGNDALNTCSCNQTAYLTFSHPSPGSGLPQACKRLLLGGQVFVVSKESILKIVKTWSSFYVRSGPVFESLVRLLESGTYNWLDRNFRYEDSRITVKDNVIEAVDRQTVAPLTLDSVIVASSFSIWWKLLKYANLVFAIELMVTLIRISFSFEAVQ